MPKIIELSLKPHQCLDTEAIRQEIRHHLGNKNMGIQLLKKSLDARSKKNIHFVIRASVFEDGEKTVPSFVYDSKSSFKNTCHIVGFGPAGIYAALECLAMGIKPIVIERGKEVKERRRDLAAINKERIVNPESNYCFGEGGAGTYSDGKLYTRSKKRGDIAKVLAGFVQFGADEKILYEAHPHIGTNKLPAIIEQMRVFITANGGEIRFNAKLTDLEIKQKKVSTITINHNEVMPVQALILATGHSARDIFKLLQAKSIAIELKPFALGIRIEHPQEMIDEMQYHCPRGDLLPPASYSLVNQVENRGVFSFCMCPGGIIAPAATANNETVVNGWSPSKRNGKFANSGMVVQLLEKDFNAYAKQGALAAMAFQAEVEKKCFDATGSIMAPAQHVGDFLNHKVSKTIGANSYIPGVQSIDLREVLPAFIAKALKNGIRQFGSKMKGYDSNEGIMVATESRTSSPVRIPRNVGLLSHPEVENLFPCGEGAGYAGGIVSAAIDGINCSRAVEKFIFNN